jgi:Zn-dependent peptidase ImmA (M78 family)
MKSYINPEIITWARERAGLTVEALAKRMKKEPGEIELWETGGVDPSYATLEHLAYRHLKIPLALFFFPEPPDIEDPKKKFRRLPSYELERFSPDTYQKIRQAQAYQDSLFELMGDLPIPPRIFDDIAPGRLRPSEAAHKAREYLGINLRQQFSFPSCESAFKGWRHVIEEAGVYTFKDSFKDKFVSGFSLLSEDFPVILVNNSNSFSRQVFTLIHELGHILYGVNGVTDIDETYIDLMGPRDRALEIKCNQFSADFLVPASAFKRDIQRFHSVGPRAISGIADKYSVSREVILRRLLDHGAVTREYYEEKSALWNKEYLRREKSPTGGNYYLTRLAYLGEGFTGLAFENYHRGRIGRTELANHLNMNSRNLPKLESYMRW